VYCSSCGVDSVEGLKYCKRCGANLTTSFEVSPAAKMPVALTLSFLVVIGFVFCVGLGVPMAAAEDLARIGFSTRELLVIFAADLAVTLSIVAMVVWLFLRLIRLHHQTRPVRTIDLQPNESARPQIAAPPQSVGSVTENTTRTLDQRRYETPREL
jgi:uncharacterized paraquat-inducible protein A